MLKMWCSKGLQMRSPWMIRMIAATQEAVIDAHRATKSVYALTLFVMRCRLTEERVTKGCRWHGWSICSVEGRRDSNSLLTTRSTSRWGKEEPMVFGSAPMGARLWICWTQSMIVRVGLSGRKMRGRSRWRERRRVDPALDRLESCHRSGVGEWVDHSTLNSRWHGNHSGFSAVSLHAAHDGVDARMLRCMRKGGLRRWSNSRFVFALVRATTTHV
jgi:hypothetical protein